MKHLILIPFALLFFACSEGANMTGDLESDGDYGYYSSDNNDGLEGAEIQLASGAYDFTGAAKSQTDAHSQQLAYADNSQKKVEEQPTDSQPKKVKQKLIRTANMSVEVSNYEKARNELNEILEKFQARIEDESEVKQSYRIQNRFIIRVAPEQLDDLIAAIADIGIDVDEKSIKSKNVTRQYVDLETRLSSKRAVIKRYREILTTAKSVKDILEVEEHLRKVVEEVESIEGQLRVLKDQIGESTLNLMIYQTLDRPNVKKDSFWSRMGKALGNGWRGGQEFVLGLVALWPFWIVAGGLFWGVRRLLKRRKAKKGGN